MWQVIADQEFYDDVMSYAPHMGISLLVVATRRLPLEQTVRLVLHAESIPVVSSWPTICTKGNLLSAMCQTICHINRLPHLRGVCATP